MYKPVLRLSSPSTRYLAMAMDALIIYACAWLSYVLNTPDVRLAVLPSQYTLVAAAIAFFFPVYSSSLYRSWRVQDLWPMLRMVALSWIRVALVLLCVLFLTKTSQDFSRIWFVLWGLSVMASLLLARMVVYVGLRWLRINGYSYKTVLLVGDSPSIQSVELSLIQSGWTGMRLLGKILPEHLDAFLLEQQAKKTVIDEVWLCLRRNDQAGTFSVLKSLRLSTANIRLVPDWAELKIVNHGVSEMLGIQMLDLSTSPITGDTRILKTLQDYLLGSLILLLILPLMLLIALAIKLTSPGPVIYQQRRHGWNGREMWVYKFRSMVEHKELNAEVTQASKNDMRITSLGAFLRRTSLDELPQFINVLQGRMSIVGPRPHAMVHNKHYQELVPRYALRHKVKPGITGWAQINGFRGETDTLDKMQKRVDHDLYYIEHVSLGLDLKIIFMTVFKGFVHKNAY